MKRFIEGAARDQGALFPPHLDDFISDDNPVRAVDAFVEALDLREMGFAGVDPCTTGRPGYHPSVLLKLYIYGYLNRIPSSRRLEREAGRNIELLWLLGQLTPDDKTIADFRKDHTEAIGKVCAQFVVLCRELGMFTNAVVAIDGSKFKAVNHRDKNFTPNKIASRMKHIEASLARYLEDLARADRLDHDVAKAKTARLDKKITRLKQYMSFLKEMEKQVQNTPDGQVSLTDPDARSMKSTGKGTGTVGYNVQIAVDAEHHLIVTHEVTNVGGDRALLKSMGENARDASGVDELTTLADRGYYNRDEILACEGTGVSPHVPKILTSANPQKGLFTIRDFIYDAEKDHYTCPAGEHLTKGETRSDRSADSEMDHYRHLTACQTCPLKPQCTPTQKVRRVKRWKHEAVLDAMQDRLDKMPDAMTIRRQTVEHPFGTIKSWMGATHFLTKTLPKVKTEMSLQVLAYNLKRMINIFGVRPLIQAMGA